MKEGWIGFDLDGTLAKYDGWRGETHIGEPIEQIVKEAKRFLSLGYEVKIFTARVAESENNKDGSKHTNSAVINAIQDWTEKHIGKRLEVTNKKDFRMIELWDDRAVQVVPNTGLRVDQMFRK